MNKITNYLISAVFLNPESPDSFESAEGSGWVRKHHGQASLL